MLPRSILSDGYQTAEVLFKQRRLMVGSDGPADSGKTEFALSAPGPGMVICLDRGADGVLNNPSPPSSRSKEFGFKVISVPAATQLPKANDYLPYWRDFYDEYKKCLNNVDARTVIIDGDSDSWELQRLAEFGKLTQVPPIMYSAVNAARRAMYNRAYDSGKIVICTNKIKKEYKTQYDNNGQPKLSNNGQEVREFTGEYERQGFPDQDYVFQIQLRHFHLPAGVNPVTKKPTPSQFGVRILKCKPNLDLIGAELLGEDCNFQGLVQLVYPHIPLEAWGYK